MTIEEIKNNYAVDQGYSDWEDILFHFSEFEMPIIEFKIHENVVIKLIQDELKNDFIDKLNNFHNKEIAGSDLDM